jgi:hypothetical protein
MLWLSLSFREVLEIELEVKLEFRRKGGGPFPYGLEGLDDAARK